MMSVVFCFVLFLSASFQGSFPCMQRRDVYRELMSSSEHQNETQHRVV